MGKFIYSMDIWGQETPIYDDQEISEIYSEVGVLKMNVHNKINELNSLIAGLNDNYQVIKNKIAQYDKTKKKSEEDIELFYLLVKEELELIAKLNCLQDTISDLYEIKDNLMFERKY